MIVEITLSAKQSFQENGKLWPIWVLHQRSVSPQTSPGFCDSEEMGDGIFVIIRENLELNHHKMYLQTHLPFFFFSILEHDWLGRG